MPVPTDPRSYAKFCREGHDLSLPGAYHQYADGGRRCAICRKASAKRWRDERIQTQILELVTEQAQAETRHWKIKATRLQAENTLLRGEQR